MATASAWKNLRRAFRPSVGTRSCAASSSSPAGRLGIAGIVGIVGIASMGELAPLASVLGGASPGGAGDATSRAGGRKRRLRLSCRFHPATLRLPSPAHHARSAGRVHARAPSATQRSAHTQGSRPPSTQRVHVPTPPPTTSTAPA
jgi:hypothetical protein